MTYSNEIASIFDLKLFLQYNNFAKELIIMGLLTLNNWFLF